MTTPRIRVLIGDDHATLRAGLRMLIDAQHDMTVAAEAGDGDAVLRQAALVRPDVILLDLTMPNMGGLAALERLRDVAPDSKALVLTMHDDPAYFRSAMHAGALGYLHKSAAHGELLAAIRIVHAGKPFVSQAMAQALAHDVIAGAMGGAPPSRPLLSERERAVLLLLAQGFTNQECATNMSVSVKTVETYRARLYKKLGVNSRAQLVRFAVGSGLLSPDELKSPGPDARL